MLLLFDILGISVKIGAHNVHAWDCKMHDLSLFSCKHSKFFKSKVSTVSDRMQKDSTPGTMVGYWNRKPLTNSVWLI